MIESRSRPSPPLFHSPATQIILSFTLLSWATVDGCEVAAKMLLGRREANHGSADRDGRTPVPWAAVEGHEKILRMLS